MLLKRRFFWFGRLWRRETEAGQSLQQGVPCRKEIQKLVRLGAVYLRAL